MTAPGTSKPTGTPSYISRAGVPLDEAIRAGGEPRIAAPGPGAKRVDLALVLRSRNSAALARRVDAGEQLSPQRYASEYGPDPRLVASAASQLRRFGLRATWSPGDALMQVSGSARQLGRALSVQLDRHVTADGSTVYSASRAPRFVGALRGLVQSVVGLDDYGQLEPLDTSSFNGYAPSEVLGAYHFEPLQQAGLTGQGQTVVFLEIDQFLPSDLDGFAKRFSLPPVSVAVHSEPAWGTPQSAQSSGQSESDLDLEIVHAVAPAARLVVYDSGADPASTILAAQQAVQEFPRAILSISLGACEPAVGSDAGAWDALFQQLEATGGSVFAAAGDSGAYDCMATYRPDAALAVDVPGSTPHATSVGGTALFVGAGGTYAGEAAWAGPTAQWGGGGGLSTLFRRASWQEGPGVQNQYSNGMRQVPDVSAVADINTGWEIDELGQFQPVGGTSAAAPLWAGLAALTDQALAQKGLPPIGFANPMLYYFGSHASALPALAFHDVTAGDNLHYPATVGWDFATGWGSPDAAGFVDDVIAYRAATR